MLKLASLEGFQITNLLGEVSPDEKCISQHEKFDESTYWETENLLCWAYSLGVTKSQQDFIADYREKNNVSF
jgi:hypothetical protein